VLTTMHGKEAVVAPVLRERLGLAVVTASAVDTDALGTFSGEVPRTGTMLEAAIAKARLGMAQSGLAIGMASEGSYGPHPHVPFMAGGIELMVLVDDTRGIVVSEHLVEDAPVFDHAFARTSGELGPLLERVGFPHHALIVRPAMDAPTHTVYKGLRRNGDLEAAVSACASLSGDGRALVQTDMRAHMNPTRMDSIRRLASALADRLARPCPACSAPGYGQVDVESGLPCEDCGGPSIMIRHRVFGCVSCGHRQKLPRADGLTHADPGHCPQCNP
jgi:hypothetical protein